MSECIWAGGQVTREPLKTSDSNLLISEPLKWNHLTWLVKAGRASIHAKSLAASARWQLFVRNRFVAKKGRKRAAGSSLDFRTRNVNPSLNGKMQNVPSDSRGQTSSHSTKPVHKTRNQLCFGARTIAKGTALAHKPHSHPLPITIYVLFTRGKRKICNTNEFYSFCGCM